MNPPESKPTAAAAAHTPAINNTEQRYAHLIERVGYGVYRSTPDGRFLEANSALAAMLGYDSPQELLALDMARDVYLEPQERERLRARHVTHGLQEWVSTRWKRRDGSAISIRLSVYSIMRDGEVVGYDGLVEDITERQRHEELLRRSERMASIGTTLAGVAHELNNPLAAIMGFAQLLLKKPWPSEDRAALETINHEAIRSATIVKDLLALTRKREVERRGATDINDIAGYIVRTRRYALETAGIACKVELDPTLPPVFGDRAQLEQVVLNLLTNAEQALHSISENWNRSSPPQITIRTRVERDQVAIEIEDNGPGIPENIQSKIWDPFWTTKDEGEGTGLGLSVVHSIVVDHGGTISLETGLARGARFIVHLPISKAAATAISVQASRPLDVLMVDPTAADLGFVERFLMARGHAVINAHSGDLALRLADQTSFDAVLCDAQLLDRDGVPLANALRRMRGCANARFVLALTNLADARSVRATVKDATIVARPYDVDALRRLIEGE